jgi:hypothetical protein
MAARLLGKLQERGLLEQHPALVSLLSDWESALSAWQLGCTAREGARTAHVLLGLLQVVSSTKQDALPKGLVVLGQQYRGQVTEACEEVGGQCSTVRIIIPMTRAALVQCSQLDSVMSWRCMLVCLSRSGLRAGIQPLTIPCGPRGCADPEAGAPSRRGRGRVQPGWTTRACPAPLMACR